MFGFGIHLSPRYRPLTMRATSAGAAINSGTTVPINVAKIEYVRIIITNNPPLTRLSPCTAKSVTESNFSAFSSSIGGSSVNNSKTSPTASSTSFCISVLSVCGVADSTTSELKLNAERSIPEAL